MILLIWSDAKAQDPIFSQISNSDTYVNPANSFNGLLTETLANIELQFRDQWASVNQGSVYNTIRAQFDYNVFKSDYDSWNGGLIMLRDRSGNNALRQTAIRFTTAYSRKLSGRSFRNDGSHYLTAGFSLGLAQTNADINSLWFGRQFDPLLLIPDPTLANGEMLNTDAVSYTDLAFGLKWTFVQEEEKIYHVGLGIDHINSPAVSNNSNEKLSPRFNLTTSAQISPSETFFHRPKLTFIFQDPFFQLVPGYSFAVGIEGLDNELEISIGLNARISNTFNGLLLDAYIFEMGLAADNWKFGFSFDMTANDLREFVNSNGAIELSLGYRILQE